MLNNIKIIINIIIMDYQKFFTDIMNKKEAEKLYHYCEKCNKPKNTEKDKIFALCFKCNEKKKHYLEMGVIWF